MLVACGNTIADYYQLAWPYTVISITVLDYLAVNGAVGGARQVGVRVQSYIDSQAACTLQHHGSGND